MSEPDKKQNHELTAEDLRQAAGGAKGVDQELSAEDLDRAAGGAIDSFLKLGTLKGE